MKIGSLDRCLKTIQIPNFMKNPSGVRQVVPCGRTDGQDETNSHFLHIAKRA